jgi:hypothetical protein
MIAGRLYHLIAFNRYTSPQQHNQPWDEASRLKGQETTLVQVEKEKLELEQKLECLKKCQAEEAEKQLEQKALAVCSRDRNGSSKNSNDTDSETDALLKGNFTSKTTK